MTAPLRLPEPVPRELHRLAETQLAALREVRRDLHRHPEPGWTEFRTSGLVARQLARHGYRIVSGVGCLRREGALGLPPAEAIERGRAEAGEFGAGVDLPGVVGVLERGDGPTVALRFDMDATEVGESVEPGHRPVREGFASERAGVMHACGHDGHVAIGLGVAELLAAGGWPWRGRVKLIFQPAEEGGRGARPMMEAGVVDDVDYFAALHIGSEALPLGHVALQATHFLSSVKLDADFRGVAAHAAGAPERGRNALLAASAAALGLHSLPRHSKGGTFVNAGVLRAGSGRNVVAAQAELRFEVRGETEEICREMELAARRAVEGAGAMYGVDVAIREVGQTIGAQSDAALVGRLAALVARFADELVPLPSYPLGGGEDATFFMRRVQERGGQAAYFLLGASATSGHHSATFDFDERALGYGAKLLAGLALDCLWPESGEG